LLALLVVLSAWQLTFPLLVYHAALVCFLLALAVADTSRLAALGFLALAALTRLEYAFGAVATLVLWGIVALRHRSRAEARRRVGFRPRWVTLLAALPLGAALYLALHVHGWRLGAGRGWFAFEQHYAFAASERGAAPGINPWLGYETIIQRDFPGARSLGDAVRIDSGAVARHVGRNLAAMPLRTAEFFATPHPGAWKWALAGLFFVAALGHGWSLRGKNAVGFRTWSAGRESSLAIALSGLVVIAPGAVIYAKTAYLLPIIPLVGLLVAGLGIAWGCRFRVTARTPNLGWACVIVAATAIVLSAPRPLAAPQPQPVKDNLAVLRRECPTPCRLLGLTAPNYATYLGPGYVGIEPLESVMENHTGAESGLRELVERNRPDAVLVTSVWRQSGLFDANALKTLDPASWREVALPDGELFVRRTK
jgi:hypothetical protein